VVLVGNDIHDVVTAVEIARKTVSKIKQNLIYAFLYNVILIPIAATGLLYPAFAGIAMAASSVSVTISSLTLKRWSPSEEGILANYTINAPLQSQAWAYNLLPALRFTLNL
jgi:cation transport ATPase